MRLAEGRAALIEHSPPKRRGLPVLSPGREAGGKVRRSGNGLGMRGTLVELPPAEGAAEEALGLGPLARLPCGGEELRQVAHSCQRVGVLGPQGQRQTAQRPSRQRLGLAETALGLEERRKVARAPRRFRVGGAEQRLVARERAPVERFRFFSLPGGVEEVCKVASGVQGLAAFRPQLGLARTQKAPKAVLDVERGAREGAGLVAEADDPEVPAPVRAPPRARWRDAAAPAPTARSPAPAPRVLGEVRIAHDMPRQQERDAVILRHWRRLQPEARHPDELRGLSPRHIHRQSALDTLGF
mmetsp:Transcript_33442/g.95987  ORF Transcript_33442/g.95987 Transcript_33442/m.95987 type:complete len:299 (+) Transcript_33442:222-1118(+)